MLATIVCGVLLILSIVGFIIAINTVDDLIAYPSIVFMVASATTLLASLLSGYVPLNKSRSITRTNDVIILYENCPCAYHLDIIEIHNHQVNTGNNLWCRFKIEDRSDYIIDIDALLSKGDNDEKR